MTALNPSSAAPAPVIQRLAPGLYGITLFFSALLLFAVQPMFTKMVLPRLGGAPTVWSVAMVFFQAALLCGYAYAHLVVRRLPLGLGALVHLALLASAAATLPIAVAHGFGAPPTEGIAPWLIALFTVSIGLPFMALAASAPLLQGWFAASGHIAARNPYVLYAGSNLGSFTALLAYPFAIEPYLTLEEQTRIWAVGFALLALLVAAASLLVARRPSIDMTGASAIAAPSARTRSAWIALAGVPVGLVIAVTSHITTDIASAPFLWVLPLAIYLLTFVAAFRDQPWLRREIVTNLVPIPVAILAVSLLSGERPYWLVAVIVNLLAFLLLALLCHGELYRRRPEPVFLTDFYLCVSLGGVVGGVFAALIAPKLFALVYEYPILIVAALLALPGMLAAGRKRILIECGPALAIAILAIWTRFWLDVSFPVWTATWFQIALVALAALMLLQRHRLQRFLALVVLGFVLTGLWQLGFDRVAVIRSFFGVNQVVDTADGRFRLLYHGTTVHGGERIADIEARAGARPEPLTYFYPGGPFSEGIEAVRTARGGLGRVAVAGLGAGTLACYKHDNEQWTFFEIDPAVVRIARDPRFFTYISACAPDLPVVLGDARLTLAGSARQYDLIILDVFSSDAIPVHLLTREALSGYLARLESGGAILIHITNKYMELASVVAATAAAEGLAAYHKQDDRPAAVPFDYKANVSLVALARRRGDLGDLPDRPGWHELKPVAGVSAWTDDYSNILGAIFRKRFGSSPPP